MKKVTIAMVAEHAGVSRGTVDRVLNQRPHVSPDQQERVMNAIRELGYIPSKEKQRELLGAPAARPAEKPLILGVIYPSEGGYIRREMKRGVEDAVRSLSGMPIELITEECDTRMPDEVIEYIQEMKEKGVQGIMLCAEKDDRIALAIGELAEEGIPVVTYNSDQPDSRRALFVGQDSFRSGRVAGELMSKVLRPGDGLIAAIGNLGVDTHQQRLKGFSEVMYRRGFRGDNMRVIETYNDYLLTVQRFTEALQEDSSVKGIYMANRSIVGCIEAVRRAGLAGKVHVIGHDLSESRRRIRQLLHTGEVDFIIAQNIYQESSRALLALLRLAAAGTPEGVAPVQTPIDILCAENLYEEEPEGKETE